MLTSDGTSLEMLAGASGAGDCRPGVLQAFPLESQWNLGFGVGTCLPKWKDSRRKALDLRPDIKSVLYISMRSSASSASYRVR